MSLSCPDLAGITQGRAIEAITLDNEDVYEIIRVRVLESLHDA